MPVRIRLARFGCKHNPFYRIYVADSRSRRDGKHVDIVGHYDPWPGKDGNKHVALNFDRIKYWLSKGAQPTETAYYLLSRAGLVPPRPPRNFEIKVYLQAILPILLCALHASPLTTRQLLLIAVSATVAATKMKPPALQKQHLSVSPLLPTRQHSRQENIRLHALRDLADGENLDGAATRFGKGLEQGMDPDELVAREFGKQRVRDLTQTQDKYKDKLKEKLAQRAAQLEQEKAEKQKRFALGKLAYERGQYSASLQLLEEALDDEGPFTILGGEIQLWLALAYQAEGREQDCIDMYKRVEDTHPNPRIRKQAAELRFIMEAPKLTINPEERIQLPVLTNLNINRDQNKPAVSTFSTMKRQKKQRRKTLEEEFLENYRPPAWATNRYVWVASFLVAFGLAWYSTFVRSWM